ncbi:MAG: sulfatase [Pirellulaceae bacterium]|nr:sulfatase [Pirellulaceae bacterium]
MRSFFLGLALLIAVTATANADERPNVVMAFADDWGQYASAYAKWKPGGISDAAKTPHFDAVADQGVLFTRAFVSAPSCTPCRSSLLSGQHFWRCERGAILQGAIWDLSIPSYPLLLESAGYRIGHTYKVWSPGTPADAPHGGAERRFAKAGRKFNRFSQNALNGPDVESAKQKLLDEVRQNVRSFLDADNDSSIDGDEPFCYWFGPTNVHRKWIAGSGKKLWGIDPDQLKGKLPPFLPDVHVVREDFADYLGEVAAFDAALGIIIEELKRVDAYDNTMLVVSGDHGVPGVTRGKCNLYDFGTKVPLAIRWPGGVKKTGRIVDDFVTLPDLAPTFLQIAGVEIPDTMTARSLVPVLQSEASGQVDPTRDAVFTGRERHVAQARTGNKPYPQRAIRTDEYLYVINFEPERWPMGTGPGYGAPDGPMPSYELLRENTFVAFGDLDASPTKAWVATRRDADPQSFEYAFGRLPEFELYDIQKDEHCINNLADDPSMSDVRQRLHDRLMAELKKTGDPRVSDNVVFESSPYTDGYSRPK